MRNSDRLRGDFMKCSKLFAIACGSIVTLATVILYVLLFDNIFSSTIRWLSLALLIMANVIGVTKFVLNGKNIISQLVVLTSYVHYALVFVMSLVFVIFLPTYSKVYILLNVLILCALTGCDLCILYLGRRVSLENKKLSNSQSVMDACYSKSQCLAVVCEDVNYKKDLNDISELIKYSDNSDLTGDEVTIMTKLSELEDEIKNKGDNISSIITEIKEIINLRSIKIKSMKRGGF